MPDTKNNKYDPAEKVERMNRVFDQVVLPALIFTVIMFVITAIMLNPSCRKEKEEISSPTSGSYQNLDAYLMREVLLEDMESNRSIFELGGYTIVETEQSGIVAYCQLDENTQVFDNIADSSGSRYSAIVSEKEGRSVTIRVYSDTIFLVEIAEGEKKLSAIFRDKEAGDGEDG